MLAPTLEDRKRLLDSPLDTDVFLAWMKWFTLIFREPVSAAAVEAIRQTLDQLGFTTRDFAYACDKIVETCRRYPLVRDFIEHRGGDGAVRW